MRSADVVWVERVRGASLGAMIMGGFGGAWLAVGAMSLGISSRTAWMASMSVAVLIAVLGVAARRRLPPPGRAETPERKESMKAFAMVNVAQWLAIFGVANLLRNLHAEVWVLPSIVLIVGAHFVPLARIFGARAHLMTGLGLMACAAISLFLPPSSRDAFVCLGAGLLLWMSAAHALQCAFRTASRQAPAVHMQQAAL